MVAVGLLIAQGAAAEEWETVMTGPLTVRTRVHPENAKVKEVWAEAIMNAEVQDVQATILDAEAYPRFMPYVKETKVLSGGHDEEKNNRLVYTRLSLPFVEGRDYVVRVFVDETVDPDGAGEFKNRWKSEPDAYPLRTSIVRLRFNVGSWHVKPLPDGRSKVTYRAAVDPGGWVPSFAQEIANKKGVQETFTAVEKEAKHRGEERKQQAMLNPRAGSGAVAPRLAQ